VYFGSYTRNLLLKEKKHGGINHSYDLKAAKNLPEILKNITMGRT